MFLFVTIPADEDREEQRRRQAYRQNRRYRRRESDTGINSGIVLRTGNGRRLVSLNPNGTMVIVSLHSVFCCRVQRKHSA